MHLVRSHPSSPSPYPNRMGNQVRMNTSHCTLRRPYRAVAWGPQNSLHRFHRKRRQWSEWHENRRDLAANSQMDLRYSRAVPDKFACACEWDRDMRTSPAALEDRIRSGGGWSVVACV